MGFFSYIGIRLQHKYDEKNTDWNEVLTVNLQEMIKANNTINEYFANFGENAKGASVLADCYLQNGTYSAIDTPGVGHELKNIWEKHADPEFDNFIKNFDVWGAAMVQENKLTTDYMEQARKMYENMTDEEKKQAYYHYVDLKYGQSESTLDLGKIGYVTVSTLLKYRDEHGLVISSEDMLKASEFIKRYKESTMYGYERGFEKLTEEQKYQVLKQNSQTAEEFNRLYRDTESEEYKRAYADLNPGERQAVDQLNKNKIKVQGIVNLAVNNEAVTSVSEASVVPYTGGIPGKDAVVSPGNTNKAKLPVVESGQEDPEVLSPEELDSQK